MAGKRGLRRPRHSIRWWSSWSFLSHLRIIASAPRCSIRSTRSCFCSARGAGRLRELGRDRQSSARRSSISAAPVPPVQGRHAVARPARRYFRSARRRAVPGLLHRLGRQADGAAADIIAIDGKTLRRSYQEGGAKAPIHMISAWVARQRSGSRSAKVADKSNEITAIPKLLDLMTIKGATSPSMRWDASARSRPRSSPRRPIM